MKLSKYLSLFISTFAISCCFSCGNNSEDKPEPIKDPNIIIKAKNIKASNGIEFEYEGDSNFKVDWGDSTTKDAHKAFHTYDSNLDEATITIKGNFDEIRFADDRDSFKDNKNLIESVSLDESITYIPDYSFYKCNSLKQVAISSSVTSIGRYAFYSTSLIEIIIPKSVETIGGYAFGSSPDLVIYCEAEEKPSGWDSDWNSDNCPSYFGYISKGNIDGLQYITAKGNTYITKYIGDATEVEIPSFINNAPVTNIGDKAFEKSSVISVTLPNTLKTIGDSAFYSCDSLREIVIPKSVEKIGGGAFGICFSLVIYCEAEEEPTGWDPNWNPLSRPTYLGCLACGDLNGLHYVTTSLTGTHIIEYTGSDNILEIPSVINNAPVTSIDGSAFYNSSITSVELPDTLKTIGGSAFYGCKSLREIVIPKSVEKIEEQAFGTCYDLTIYCEAEEEPTGWDPNWNSQNCPVYFGYISHGTSIGLNYVNTSEGAHILKYVGDASVVDIPITLKGSLVAYIDDSAFKFTSVTLVTLPNTIKAIGNNAFSSCFSLNKIDLTGFTSSTNLPTAEELAFNATDAIFWVANQTIAEAFKAKGGGWPTSLDRYNWPGK